MDGSGGLFTAGRWHRLGSRVVYFGSSAAIVVLELLAHIDPGVMPKDLVLSKLVGDISVSEWGPTVNLHDIDETQEYGDTFLQAGAACALRVSSAIVPEEFNFVVNALHPDAAKLAIVKTRPFVFDPRLSVPQCV